MGLARRLGIQPQRPLCFKLGPRERNLEATLAALPKKKLAEASTKNLQPQRPRLETQPAENTAAAKI